MKRLLGWLFAIIALAVIAFAVLNYGNYTSMCFNDDKSKCETTSITSVDTTGEAPVVVDSLPLAASPQMTN